jgi:hypothetical protein
MWVSKMSCAKQETKPISDLIFYGCKLAIFSFPYAVVNNSVKAVVSL